jgi:DNA polymerase-1
MEQRGITMSRKRLEESEREYGEESKRCHRVCVEVSGGQIDKLPVSGNSNALKHVIFDVFKLKSNKRTEKGSESLDRTVLEHWLATLPVRSKAYRFVHNLQAYRKRMTALNYMASYRRFWLPIKDGFAVMHPSLNPTGTGTLRFSSSNPNEQNISKQEGFNLRYCFGPAPGRVWYSMDYVNLELHIPAYEADERDVIYVFEHPDEPPYYGSYHLLVADLLHPELFKQHGKNFKKIFESTWYQWVKNGNFAVIYGAQRDTADRTYHAPGAFDKIQHRFPKIAALAKMQIELADKRGYVETMPDKTVDPERGYPLLCSRSRWGKVSPTVPLNYHVQGTAMWCTMKAMIRCHEFLEASRGAVDAYMIMQVHDEIVFDFPRREVDYPQAVRVLKALMEQSGDDIGVPTPVSVERHDETWSEGASDA